MIVELSSLFPLSCPFANKGISSEDVFPVSFFRELSYMENRMQFSFNRKLPYVFYCRAITLGHTRKRGAFHSLSLCHVDAGQLYLLRGGLQIRS